MNNELYHYGVLGMKWGVRRYQNKDGSLNDRGKKKFYNKKGELNRAGRRAKSQAQKYSEYGKMSTGLNLVGAGIGAAASYKGYKYSRDFIHQLGNVTVTAQRMSGVNFNVRKATAAAFIAGMGALTYSQISKPAQQIGNNLMYKHDKDYQKRVDSLADMKLKQK